jgi:hypothetical protein
MSYLRYLCLFAHMVSNTKRVLFLSIFNISRRYSLTVRPGVIIVSFECRDLNVWLM